MWQKILLGVGVLAVGGLIVWGALSSDAPAAGDAGNPNAPVVYYYGDGCPHCEDVQAFFDEEGIVFGEDLAKKEVWSNRANREEMLSRAEECGLTPEDVGVPFLWAEGKCSVGEPDVVDYFEERN